MTAIPRPLGTRKTETQLQQQLETRLTRLQDQIDEKTTDLKQTIQQQGIYHSAEEISGTATGNKQTNKQKNI